MRNSSLPFRRQNEIFSLLYWFMSSESGPFSYSSVAALDELSYLQTELQVEASSTRPRYRAAARRSKSAPQLPPQRMSPLPPASAPDCSARLSAAIPSQRVSFVQVLFLIFGYRCVLFYVRPLPLLLRHSPLTVGATRSDQLLTQPVALPSRPQT